MQHERVHGAPCEDPHDLHVLVGSEDDLPSNARWLSIRNRSLVVSAKEVASGESTLLRGEALKKLRSLDAEQSIFISSGSGAAASAPAAAPQGSETDPGQSETVDSKEALQPSEAELGAEQLEGGQEGDVQPSDGEEEVTVEADEAAESAPARSETTKPQSETDASDPRRLTEHRGRC